MVASQNSFRRLSRSGEVSVIPEIWITTKVSNLGLIEMLLQVSLKVLLNGLWVLHQCPVLALFRWNRRISGNLQVGKPTAMDFASRSGTLLPCSSGGLGIPESLDHIGQSVVTLGLILSL